MWPFTSCSPVLYQENRPLLKIDSFFSDILQGWGILESKTGIVKRRFTIHVHSEWEGTNGKITEIFSFDNTEEEKREWFVQLISEQSFLATSPSIVGIAKGTQIGNAINFSYISKVTFAGRTHTVNLADWWFLIDEKNLMAQAKVKKFGITWANLIVFYQKP